VPLQYKRTSRHRDSPGVTGYRVRGNRGSCPGRRPRRRRSASRRGPTPAPQRAAQTARPPPALPGHSP
jgi:hypothetical protein